MKRTLPAIAESHVPAFEHARVVERPDGFHWLSLDGRREGGSFASFLEALCDMEREDVEDEPAAVSLEEAEADTTEEWLDRDTGEAAEDASFHLEA
jgi:hypothetical protein